MKEFKTLLVVHQTNPFQASIGIIILSLMLLISINTWIAITFIAGIFLLTEAILLRILGIFSFQGIPGLNIVYVLQTWANATKRIPAMFKKNDTDEVSSQDTTFLYSEMPGGLSEVIKSQKGIQTNEQFDKIRKHI
jgi:hypothetical protein|tara:strand:- start:6785 stop:7192 length:408 start_codon:yes stop_codon:yes gene_type:complete